VTKQRLLASFLIALVIAGASWSYNWAVSLAPQGSALDRSQLPFYSHSDLLPRWDKWSQARTVGSLEATDQHDHPIDQRLFANGPTIVSFFWAGCVSTCPMSTELLLGLKNNPQILLITDQPLVDRPAVLRSYRSQLSLPASWTLATGAPRDIFGFARQGLFTNIEKRAGDGGPQHSEVNYLIDRVGRIRGIYLANSASEAVRLQSDFDRLQMEIVATEGQPAPRTES
jgi:protein SCO1